MPRLFAYPGRFPPAGAVLAVLVAAYLLPGMAGHDPWKADDATHFGIVYSMLESGRWLPELAGEPIPGAPPLHYWVAAPLARLLSLALPLHDAVRLVTALFGAAFVWAMTRVAGQLRGAADAPAAALVTIGCLGLLVHVHDTQPRIALLAALAFCLYGLASIPDNPVRAGLIAGIAAGASVLAGGALGIALLGPLIVLLPLASGRWRSRAALTGLALTLGTAALVTAAWPAALAIGSGGSLEAWWSRLLGEWDDPSRYAARLAGFASLLPWFAWPALPLALWTLWLERRSLAEPAVVLPLATLFVFLLALPAIETPRSLAALPLLIPCIALAAPAVATLRRGAANAFDWFGMMTFTLFGGLIWLGWIAMSFGVPPRIARNFAKLEPGFVMQFQPGPVGLAVALTLAWIWLIVSAPRSPARGTVTWAAGMTLIWALATSLWMPWLDYGKSYRQLAASLERALPPGHGCITRVGLGEAQRASLDYFAGIRTVPERSARAAGCRLLLLYATGRQPRVQVEDGWRQIWEDRRPGDRNETFRLYVRE